MAERAHWTIVLTLAAATFVLSLLVIRTGSTANALALPGGAGALDAMLKWARLFESVLLRTLATASALLAATPSLASGMLLGLPNVLIRAVGSSAARRASPDGYRPNYFPRKLIVLYSIRVYT